MLFHTDKAFHEKSDEVYHPSNVESILVGDLSDEITQLSIEITAFSHPFKCMSWVAIAVVPVFTVFLTQRTGLPLARQSSFCRFSPSSVGFQ